MARPVIDLRALFEDGLALLADLLRFKAVFFVEHFLLRPASLGFIDGAGHGFRDGVGVHDDAPIDIPCGTACSLGQ